MFLTLTANDLKYERSFMFCQYIIACFNANYVSITILESLLLEILYYRENIKRITVKIAVVVHYESLH